MSITIEVPIELEKLASDVFDKKQYVDMLAQMNVPHDPVKARKQYIAYEAAKYAYSVALKRLEDLRNK